MISVEELTKEYDKLTALYAVTFGLKKGSALGVLGQAGSGKSTLLNIICGVTAPTSGSVKICGKDISKSPVECKKKTGYMPEEPPVYPDMTVGEYLDFVCRIKKVDKIRRISEIMRLKEAAALNVSNDVIISSLNRLCRQKLSLCQALAGEPEILLFDEPTKKLDASEAYELITLIKASIKGRTVVYATKDLPECVDMCENVMILNRGRIAVNSTLARLSAEVSEMKRIKLRALCQRSRATLLFKDIPDIKDCEILTADEKGALDVVLTYPADKDLRKLLWQKSQESNIPVLEMKQLNISLEDIYLQISAER